MPVTNQCTNLTVIWRLLATVWTWIIPHHLKTSSNTLFLLCFHLPSSWVPLYVYIQNINNSKSVLHVQLHRRASDVNWKHWQVTYLFFSNFSCRDNISHSCPLLLVSRSPIKPCRSIVANFVKSDYKLKLHTSQISLMARILLKSSSRPGKHMANMLNATEQLGKPYLKWPRAE